MIISKDKIKVINETRYIVSDENNCISYIDKQVKLVHDNRLDKIKRVVDIIAKYKGFNNTEIKVLFIILDRAYINPSNTIILNSVSIHNIAKELNVVYKTVYNAINNIKKRGLIVNINSANSRYRFNEDLKDIFIKDINTIVINIL